MIAYHFACRSEAPVRAFAAAPLRMRGYTVVERIQRKIALKTLEVRRLTVDVVL